MQFGLEVHLPANRMTTSSSVERNSTIITELVQMLGQLAPVDYARCIAVQAAAGRLPAAVASCRIPGSICGPAIDEMPSRI